MNSADLIAKFPSDPAKPILYVIYEDAHRNHAEYLIDKIHGKEYRTTNITIVDINDKEVNRDPNDVDVWIDPTVFLYINSWNG